MSGDAVETLAVAAMATRFEFVLIGADRVRLRAAGEAAIEEVLATEVELSRFRSDGFVALVNRIGDHTSVRADQSQWEWLELVDEVNRLTGGAYDVCHGGPGGLVLDREQRRVALSAPGTRVDLGSIGKGIALDRAAQVLREGGVGTALVHGGTSTVLALGAPPGRAGFRIEVARGDGTTFGVDLAGGALSVSAQHGQDRLVGGGHVVDARDGSRASTTNLVACTAPRATLADLWSTALLAAGVDDSLVRAAAAHGVALLYSSPATP